MNAWYRVIVVANSLALLLSGAVSRTYAQTPSKPTKTSRPADNMVAMRDGPHHALLIAYRDNVTIFARAIQRQATLAKTVDLKLARSAIAEMRRSFGLIQLHHRAQMTGIGDRSKDPMGMRLAALNEHLTALESALNDGTPEPKKVAAHATEILHQCAGVSLSAQATAHR